MIVAPRWVRREKRTRRYRELLDVRYHRQWHEPGSSPYRWWTGTLFWASDESFHAYVDAWNGPRNDLGIFPTVEMAQTAVDALLSNWASTPVAEAEANWKTWNRERRRMAKADREARQRKNEAKMTPEARERSRKLVEALGGRR